MPAGEGGRHLAGFHVKHPDDTVAACFSKRGPTGAKGDMECFGICHRDNTLAAGDIPNPDGAIAVAGGHCLAVRTEGNRKNVSFVSVESSLFFGGSNIPQLHALIRTCRRYDAAVVVERHRRYWFGVTFESGGDLAGRHVPELDRAIATAGGQYFAVWTEGHGVDVPG